MTRRAPFSPMLFVLGFACLSSFCFCRSTLAYSLNGKTWATGSNIVLRFGLGQPAAPLLDGNTSWDTAAAPAFEAWNQKMARVQMSGVMNSAAPVATGDGVNSVTFASSVFGQSFGSGTLAVTWYMMQGSSLIEADVLFNSAQTFNSYRGPLRFDAPGGYATGDIRRVLLHELGHALGLNHAEGDNIMAPVTSNRETLSNDDVAGVQAMYGTPPPGPTPTPTPATGSHVRNDFNVDAKPDVVWQNRITGQRAVWLMNGATRVGESLLPTVATSWQIAGSGDFNGDGYADMVWQNNVGGQRALWLMNGANIVATRALPMVSTSWQIAGTGDFSGDGQADLLWQNVLTGQRSIWLMNGTTMVGSRVLPTVSVLWQIAGTGDFNADGQLDIIWQNSLTGQRVIWLMNGSAKIGDRTLPTVGSQWEIRNH